MSDKIKNMILRRMRKHGGDKVRQQEPTPAATETESVDLAKSKAKARTMGDLRHQELIPPEAKTETVTIAKSHQHIDYFLLNDQFAVCNRCGIANPIARFQMEHKTGCEVCGAEPRSKTRESKSSDESDTVPAPRETDPQERQYTQEELDNPLSSANDRWTGDPETDRAQLFARAMHAAYLSRTRDR